MSLPVLPRDLLRPGVWADHAEFRVDTDPLPLVVPDFRRVGDVGVLNLTPEERKWMLLQGAAFKR